MAKNGAILGQTSTKKLFAELSFHFTINYKYKDDEQVLSGGVYAIFNLFNCGMKSRQRR